MKTFPPCSKFFLQKTCTSQKYTLSLRPEIFIKNRYSKMKILEQENTVVADALAPREKRGTLGLLARIDK